MCFCKHTEMERCLPENAHPVLSANCPWRTCYRRGSWFPCTIQAPRRFF